MSHPQHGFGPPPLEKGWWFCYYSDKDRWSLTDNTEDIIKSWNSGIKEYYGPIPSTEFRPNIHELLENVADSEDSKRASEAMGILMAQIIKEQAELNSRLKKLEEWYNTVNPSTGS